MIDNNQFGCKCGTIGNLLIWQWYAHYYVVFHGHYGYLDKFKTYISLDLDVQMSGVYSVETHKYIMQVQVCSL